MAILKNKKRTLGIISILLAGIFLGFFLQACKSEEKTKMSSLEKKNALLAENKESSPREVSASLASLAVSGSRETCNYFSAQYKKNLIRDFQVGENKICEVLFPQRQGRVKAEKTVLLQEKEGRAKTVSAFCLMQKTELAKPKFPKGFSKKEKERLLRSFEKSMINTLFLGPFLTEISFNEKEGRWEMLTLPANTVFKKGKEQKAAKQVTQAVKKEC